MIITALYGVSLVDGIGIIAESGCAASADLKKQWKFLINIFSFVEQSKN